MITTLARMLPIVVGTSIGSVFAIGARRGFAMRRPHPPAPTRVKLAGWFVVIGVLIGWELWQLAHGASTATALVHPLLALPLVRGIVIAVWLWLGWELARK